MGLDRQLAPQCEADGKYRNLDHLDHDPCPPLLDIFISSMFVIFY